MSAAIIVENLSKRYVIGHAPRHDTLRDSLAHGFKGLWRSRKNNASGSSEEFWALRDVGFAIPAGEVVGIVGRNGAGKSTLLKILSRITEPTRGRVTLNGRVASLLEVGTGFHPELTGRENIFLNGAILGMSRAEISRKFDEIVAFSEVERFLDTPVKRYSSGMYVRLAFAVAAHLDPEILIVDEVLAVGDQQFQRKCLGKMREVAGGGRTVLFVSHNLSAVRSLCTSALLLDRGRAGALAPVAEVLAAYTKSASGPAIAYERSAPPAGTPCLLSARLHTSSEGDTHETDAPLVFELAFHPAASAAPVVNVHIFDAEQTPVMQSSSMLARCEPQSGPVRKWRVVVPPRTLNIGEYRCTLVVAEYGVAIYEQLDLVLGFTVIDTAFPGPGEASGWAGSCSPKLLEWSNAS